MANERRTINDVLVNLAGALVKQFGEGYLDVPVEGIVLAVTLRTDAEVVKKINSNHGTDAKAGTAVVGTVLYDAPKALAQLLHQSGISDRFMASLQMELQVERLTDILGGQRITLEDVRTPKSGEKS